MNEHYTETYLQETVINVNLPYFNIQNGQRFLGKSKIVKYCIITLNWDSLVVMLSIVCGARYVISMISDCLVSKVMHF